MKEEIIIRQRRQLILFYWRTLVKGTLMNVAGWLIRWTCWQANVIEEPVSVVVADVFGGKSAKPSGVGWRFGRYGLKARLRSG